MITKAKTLLYSTSNGETFHTIEGAKKVELANLCNADTGMLATAAFDVLIAKPREAIAILRFGLPRKPRTPKAKKKTASQRIREEIGAPLRAQ